MLLRVLHLSATSLRPGDDRAREAEPSKYVFTHITTTMAAEDDVLRNKSTSHPNANMCVAGWLAGCKKGKVNDILCVARECRQVQQLARQIFSVCVQRNLFRILYANIWGGEKSWMGVGGRYNIVSDNITTRTAMLLPPVPASQPASQPPTKATYYVNSCIYLHTFITCELGIFGINYSNGICVVSSLRCHPFAGSVYGMLPYTRLISYA